MARTQLTVQTIGRGATTAELASVTWTTLATDGFWFDNSGRNNYILFRNTRGDAAAVTLTIQTDPNKFTDKDLPIPDRTHAAVADGDTALFGPYPSDYEQDDPGATITNAVYIDIDAGDNGTCEIAIVKGLTVNQA